MAHSPKRGKQMHSGKRSPTAHRTLEQGRAETTANKSPAEKAKNRSRLKARRAAIKSGAVRRGDGKDVHHKDGNANNNSKKNLAVASRKTNRNNQRKR